MRIRTRAVVTAGLAIFFLLTVLVWTGAIDGLDRFVARFAARHQTDPGLTAARVITDVFSPAIDGLVLILGAAVVAIRRRRWRPLVFAICVLAVVSTVVLGLKAAIDRPLPHSHGHPDMGYPSGHTAATACFLGALAVMVTTSAPELRRRLLAVVGASSVLVAVALVSAGFHWLTDTVASLALGAAVVAGLTLDRLGRALTDP